mgnify:CR=1 FL=1
MEDEKKVVILNWLLAEDQQDMRMDYQDGKGFQVSGRTMIQPKGKAPMPITEALRQNGFNDGDEIGGYQVRVKPAGERNGKQYAETFKFFVMRPPVPDSDDIF